MPHTFKSNKMKLNNEIKSNSFDLLLNGEDTAANKKNK